MNTNNSKITFTINGKQTEMTIPPSMLLIDLIREELGLKGTKPGCLEMFKSLYHIGEIP